MDAFSWILMGVLIIITLAPLFLFVVKNIHVLDNKDTMLSAVAIKNGWTKSKYEYLMDVYYDTYEHTDDASEEAQTIINSFLEEHSQREYGGATTLRAAFLAALEEEE